MFFNKLYRIPVDAAGKAGQPDDIWMDQPVRALMACVQQTASSSSPKMPAARISVTTVNGDKASVTVLKEGLKELQPQSSQPAILLWFTERATGKVMSIPMPK